MNVAEEPPPGNDRRRTMGAAEIVTSLDDRGRCSMLRTMGVEQDPLERRAEDERLLTRLRAGDLDAFEALYHRHAPRVFGLALRMLRNRADAEDLLQEIFMQAYDKLPSFQGRSAFSTWLYRLSVNRCLDHLRSRSSKEQAKTDTLDPIRPGTQFPGGTDSLELEHAIGELPPSTRAAFLLYDVEGYDHKEVSAMLDIAVGTSKSLVHRARMKLRNRLKPRSLGGTS